MTIVFAGGEMGSFVPSNGANQESASYYDGNYARGSTRAIGDSTLPNNEGTFLKSLKTVWTHIEHNMSVGEGIDANWWDVIIWGDADRVDRISLQVKETTSQIRLVYNNGTTWVQVGSPYTVSYIDRQLYDFKFKVNTTAGIIELYRAGVKVIDGGTINLSSMPAIHNIRLQGGKSNVTGVASHGSQIIVASVSTIDWKMTTYVPTGAGNVSEWAGTYAAIDELAFNDGDAITIDAPGSSNFAMTPVHALPASTVRGVVVTVRARRGTNAPTAIAMTVDSSGTDHFSADQEADEGFAPYIAIWETNPETGKRWIPADLTNLKTGVKASG